MLAIVAGKDQTSTYNRETVAATAIATGKVDVGAAVNSKAIVVVIYCSTGDGKRRRTRNIESVGVVAQGVISSTCYVFDF